jgi:hypothetical protein
MDFDEQLALLRQYIERDTAVVEVQPLNSGARVLRIRNYKLPTGWNQSLVTVQFYVPPGYPSANPDCFWVEPNLRLSNGELPQASNESNPMPEVGPCGTWFSWHIQGWSPNQSTLVTFANGIRARLDPAR